MGPRPGEGGTSPVGGRKGHGLRRLALAVSVVALAFGTACGQAASTNTAMTSAGAAPPGAAEQAHPYVPVASAAQRVVPEPVQVQPNASEYWITDRTVIHAPNGSAPAVAIARQLAALLRPSTGYPLPVTGTGPGPAGGITLALGGAGADLGTEGYRLTVDPAGVTIRANAPAGLFYGVQTLHQLLPAAADAATRQSGPWVVPGGQILDYPRFAYRGAMLDVSRHFFPIADVERYIDEISRYKVNYLHLHLSDDQGWRIVINGWPRLAAYGGSTEVGGGPGGYYTQDQYRQIVAYAQAHFVTIVPEIDGPGHTNAALASYAQLNCDGKAPPLYTGTNVGFSSLCVGKDITYAFEHDVLSQLAALTPGPYLHVGGDEAQSTTAADYQTFEGRLLPIVRQVGKAAIAWHDITKVNPPTSVVPEYWGTTTADPNTAAAAARGNKIIMAPANKAYLDQKYTPATKLGLNWAAYIEVHDAYDWDPGNYLTGVTGPSVLGVEAPLWSETLVTMPNIEYLAFPRLPTIAELGWSPEATHDWASFQQRLGAQGPRWTVEGINFYASPQIPWAPGTQGGID